MTEINEQESFVVEEIEENAAVAATTEKGFKSFGLGADLMRGIKEAGFTEPTLIQQKAIPELMAGRDLIGQALTGSGKTAAYGLPAMERIRGKAGLQFLTLVPTRELAAQVSSELFKLGHHAGIKTAAFTGGQAYSRQENLLRQGINILVATPGRLIDLIKTGHFDGMNPSVIVVDEADEMLDMGFLDDVKTILDQFPGPHQTMLFSATLPKQVVNLAQKILHNPVDITTAISEATNNDIEQQYFVIEEHERVNAVIRLIDSDNVSKAIIFCRTREETDALNILLGGRGYNVNCLHGDMEQAQRSRVMNAFRKCEIDILVATDVAARGLDVDDVSHVFNFHMPFDSRGYVHRIGRTGRAGKAGKAITLVSPRELRQLEAIRHSVGAEIQLGMIPTRKDVYTQRLQKLFAELFASDLDPSLYHQVLEISKDQDQDAIVLFTKLLTRFLSNSSDQGPERIGLFGDRLDRLVNNQNRPERRDSRDNNRRGGNSSWGRGRGDNKRRPDFVREERGERSTGASQNRDRARVESKSQAAGSNARNLAGFEQAIRIAEDIDRERQQGPAGKRPYRSSAEAPRGDSAGKRPYRSSAEAPRGDSAG
ncbi:MAG: DEAD/DEAH box helicase, partial [Lentisphaeria bacterium]